MLKTHSKLPTQTRSVFERQNVCFNRVYLRMDLSRSLHGSVSTFQLINTNFKMYFYFQKKHKLTSTQGALCHSKQSRTASNADATLLFSSLPDCSSTFPYPAQALCLDHQSLAARLAFSHIDSLPTHTLWSTPLSPPSSLCPDVTLPLFPGSPWCLERPPWTHTYHHVALLLQIPPPGAAFPWGLSLTRTGLKVEPPCTGCPFSPVTLSFTTLPLSIQRSEAPWSKCHACQRHYTVNTNTIQTIKW